MSTTKFAAKFSDEERAEYRKAQRDEATAHLEAAVESMQSTDGFAAWLTARARFHNYSLNNTMLILMQCPEATRVASAKVWRELGRYPAKGSHALRVFAPIEWWIPCGEAEGREHGRYNKKRSRWERKARSFKLVPVFDVGQTAGDELPEPPASVMPDGDSHAHLEPALVTLATELGFSVSTEELGEELGGYCDSTNHRIVLAARLAPNGRVRVLVHEIAHALGVGYEEYGRKMAEVLVESVTYVVLTGQGFDADAASVGYVAGWAGRENAAASIRKFAEKIDELARRIERAL